MINTCRRCGAYVVEKRIDPAGPYAICPACGEQHRFRQLPLLLVCGPSGGGKTTTLYSLLGRMTAVVLLEGDLLWRDPFNSPDDNYRDFFDTWLRLAKNINQAGRPVVLFNAGAIPPNIESCAERRYFSESHYLALVCDDDVLAARLRARPTWRASGDETFITAQITFNQWLRTEGPLADPAVTLLDTTTAAEAETATAVASWIRRIVETA
ncbi:MAG: AAA family ATPase [Candidatus Promineifilaceae bacterium]